MSSDDCVLAAGKSFISRRDIRPRVSTPWHNDVARCTISKGHWKNKCSFLGVLTGQHGANKHMDWFTTTADSAGKQKTFKNLFGLKSSLSWCAQGKRQN